MARTEFYGRAAELRLLDRLWKSSKATLLILYGRRRVGKTRLLTHWMSEHPERSLYWVAEPTSALDQLRSFSQAIYNFDNPDAPAPLDFTYASWEQALQRVAATAKNESMFLVIDEFTYLLEVDPTIVGTMQKAWDHWLSNSNLMLALSGSQMGLMQRQVLSYQAPLYGRATMQLQLRPMPFDATGNFFPEYSPADRVTIYGIFGGIPAYWERMERDLSLEENIRLQLLSPNTLMQEEPRLLLQDFISDQHNYVSIMRAITQGAHTQNDISSRTGLPQGHISKYLSVLRETGFVERQVPVTETESSRRGRYFVTDPYLRFYYRFLATLQAQLAIGAQRQLLGNIMQSLPDFIRENTWRELCREWVLRASATGEIPLTVEQIGGDWKRDYEFEVAGIDQTKHHIVLGSCLWQEKAAGATDLHDLITNTELVVPKRGKWSVLYVGFAANGWTDDAAAILKELAGGAAAEHNWHVADVLLLDLNKVDADLSRWSNLVE
jgi:uncharacterized protein